MSFRPRLDVETHAWLMLSRREPYAVSTHVDHNLYVEVHERYVELLKTDMPTANLSYTIQPVARAAVKAGQERGGNALGLEVTPQSCKCFSPYSFSKISKVDSVCHAFVHDQSPLT